MIHPLHVVVLIAALDNFLDFGGFDALFLVVAL